MEAMKRCLGYEIQKVLCSSSLATPEIIKEVGCHYNAGYNKLNELEHLGLVKSNKDGKKRIWHLTLEPPYAEHAVNNGFSECFSKLPNNGLKVAFNHDSVEKISDGSIITIFNKTPPNIICPHFLELKWANGCHYNCAWCYLQGTFRFRGKKAYVKDPEKIRDHIVTFLQTKKPDILNAGELSDSLLDPNIYYIINAFESQNRHKLLLLTKSCSIAPLLKMENTANTIVSFSINSCKVAERWEKDAPPPRNRLDAAQLLYERGYPIRFRIDPIVPYPDRWENYYKDLIDDLFIRFRPERITLGTLRGLKSTIGHCKDDSWVPYLKEKSGWGLKQNFHTRFNAYSTLLEYLIDKYNFYDVGICKETREMWNILKPFGLDAENVKCNCTW